MSLALAEQQRRLAAAIAGAGEPSVLAYRAGRAPRIGIYRHGYRVRLAEALRSNYPVLHRVLGDEAFGDLAWAYLQARPSRRPSIRWFGDGLADWMAGQPDVLPHASLVDLARMEWSLGLSFDAADKAVLVPADLMRVDPACWPLLRFEGHPSVHALRMVWAVEPVWRTLTDDEDAEAAPPQPADHVLLVWRQGLDTRWRSLDADEAAMLQACLRGEPFAQLCERSLAVAGEAAPDYAAGLLRRWVEDGLLAWRLRTQDGPPQASV